MEIQLSQRIRDLGGYAFAEVDREVEKLRQQGVAVIDFGVGDPTIPTPEVIRKAAQQAVDARASSGYPSYIGSQEFRQAVARFYRSRFDLELDPATEITATSGSKEAVFHVHEALLDPGDLVLIPNPGYPPYSRGTQFAEGKPHYYPLTPEHGFLPDLAAIPGEVAQQAKAMWVNYPNSPSGRIPPDAFWKSLIDFAREHEIILLSDEAYSEIYFTPEPPRSILNFGRDGILVFQSLSKRSAMTGYRLGWVAGDERLVAGFRKVKTNIDSGAPTFLQDAGVAALEDDQHVQEMRRSYLEKRDVLCAALTARGLADCTPEAALYLWQKTPPGLDSVAFAKKLLHPDIGLVTTPGAWISETQPDGSNPGDGFIRFALVPGMEEIQEAARRLEKLTW